MQSTLNLHSVYAEADSWVYVFLVVSLFTHYLRFRATEPRT